MKNAITVDIDLVYMVCRRRKGKDLLVLHLLVEGIT